MYRAMWMYLCKCTSVYVCELCNKCEMWNWVVLGFWPRYMYESLIFCMFNYVQKKNEDVLIKMLSFNWKSILVKMFVNFNIKRCIELLCTKKNV